MQTVSCFEIHIGFTFLVPADPGSPGKRAVKWCVCVSSSSFINCTTSHAGLAHSAFVQCTILLETGEQKY